MDKEKITIEAVLAENERRQACLSSDLYDPLTGVGCWGDRVDVGGVLVPRILLQTCPDYARLEPVEQERRRIQEDFEFWCARCVTIKDKMSGTLRPLILSLMVTQRAHQNSKSSLMRHRSCSNGSNLA